MVGVAKYRKLQYKMDLTLQNVSEMVPLLIFIGFYKSRRPCGDEAESRPAPFLGGLLSPFPIFRSSIQISICRRLATVLQLRHLDLQNTT
mgnify:CR=1 FL=1